MKCNRCILDLAKLAIVLGQVFWVILNMQVFMIFYRDYRARSADELWINIHNPRASL